MKYWSFQSLLHSSLLTFWSPPVFLPFNTTNNCVPFHFILPLMLLLSHIIQSEKTENWCFMILCFKLHRGIRWYKGKYSICLIFIYLATFNIVLYFFVLLWVTVPVLNLKTYYGYSNQRNRGIDQWITMHSIKCMCVIWFPIQTLISFNLERIKFVINDALMTR